MTTPTPDAETRALYESMSREDLLRMQRAFRMDKAESTQASTSAFADGRLALIAEVLAERRDRGRKALEETRRAEAFEREQRK